MEAKDMKQPEFTEEELLLLFLLAREVSDYMAKQVIDGPVDTWNLYVKLARSVNICLVNENSHSFTVQLRNDPREA
jgi:hypothetical protein